MSENRIELFDFLRGLAIFLVIINHVPYHSYNFENQSDYIVKNFLLFGTYGVQLFYIVSACTLFRSIKLRDEKNYKAFFIRRFFRIAPIFYIGIICHVIYFNDNFKNDLNFINIFKYIFY